MYWGTEIEQEQDDKLSKRVWQFTAFDMPKIHLQSVMDLSRPTKRHKYTVDKIWKRIDQRNNTMERIEPSETMKIMVKARLVAEIVFD